MTQGIKDYYAILGLERECTQEEIKRAFRAKARECHPDVCEDADGEERFKTVNEAYEVLSDPRKRDVYDRFGTADPRAVGFDMGGVQYEDIFGMGMEDVFSMFFGTSPRGGGRAVRREGRDLSTRLVVSLEEAATGVDRELDVTRDAPCEACGATGGGKVGTCGECGGSGQRTVLRRTLFGQMRSSAPCGACQGTGEVPETPCETCGGSGRARARETVTVSVPAGVRDGMSVRVSGRGEAGLRGAAAGDLVAQVRVAPHKSIFREGDDLHVRVRVSVTQAALGETVRFPGLFYEEEVAIPRGSQWGDTMRVRGRGMPDVAGNGAGDLIVHLAVDVPKKPDARQERLLRELGETLEDGKGTARVDRLRDWLGTL